MTRSVGVLLLLAALAHAAPVPKPAEAKKIEAKFGKVVDPKGDSKFTLDGEKLVITLPANEARTIDALPDPNPPEGKKKFIRENNCPRVEFDADGDFVLTVHIDARIDPKAKEAKGESESGFLGGGIHITSEAGGWHAYALGQLSNQPQPKVRGKKPLAVVDGVRSAFLFDCPLFWGLEGYGRVTDDTTGFGRPAYLRLQRKSEEFSIAVSADQKTWHTISDEVIGEKGPLRLALFAQHSSDKAHTVTFDEFKVEAKK